MRRYTGHQASPVSLQVQPIFCQMKGMTPTHTGAHRYLGPCWSSSSPVTNGLQPWSSSLHLWLITAPNLLQCTALETFRQRHHWDSKDSLRKFSTSLLQTQIVSSQIYSLNMPEAWAVPWTCGGALGFLTADMCLMADISAIHGDFKFTLLNILFFTG